MYKNLVIWKDSVYLIKEIYKLADMLPKSEDFNLKSQLKRAVVSVSLNIAEGKCRATSKEFTHFLNTASASLYEVIAILGVWLLFYRILSVMSRVLRDYSSRRLTLGWIL